MSDLSPSHITCAGLTVSAPLVELVERHAVGGAGDGRAAVGGEYRTHVLEGRGGPYDGAAGIHAALSDSLNTTGTVSVVNGGNITVNNPNPGVVTNYGIYAFSACDNHVVCGNVTVNNTGDIDPPTFAIFASGGGNVTVTATSGAVSGTATAAPSAVPVEFAATTCISPRNSTP